VQLLPDEGELTIVTLRRTQKRLTRVEVGSADLHARAASVARALRQRPAARGVTAEVEPPAAAAARSNLKDDLAWLYDRLLRPIERDLAGARHVFVVPSGSLVYVPFAALLRRSANGTEQYAVERWHIGTDSTYEMIARAVGDRARPSGRPAVVLGDPDGSLRHARSEAHAVARLAKVPARVGREATFEALSAHAANARVVHLATHGAVDAADPSRSWLLFANGRHATLGEAASLPLDGVDLVVLSACETGITGSGSDFTSFARAFMVAGARTVVASLWTVDDAATAVLMERFYARDAAVTDRLVAMADAQRSLLADPATRDPYFWAPFVVFGSP
jgi:CHAT domain-containing protein